ncbi:MAG: hypothetical protein DRN27_07240, partial [Thermoplasmata archaeon]
DERVTEIVKYYPVDGGRFVSESLRSLTPFRSPYSFDLLARAALRWRNGPVPLNTQIKWNDNELQKARKGITDFLSILKIEQENLENSKSLRRGLKIIEGRFVKYE